ncbi:MAG: hypothetical protein LBV51_00510, partial [Acholeplasmatales bacterium]|nr:hypothetical protein [Acholeplasmatales bacterium]
MAKKQVINTNLNEEEKVSTKDISLDSSKEVKNNNSAKTLDSLPNNQVSLEDTPTTKKTKKDSSSVSAVSNDLIVKEEKVEEVSVPKTKKKKEIKEELPTLFNIDEVEAKKQEEIKLTQNLNDDIVQEATPSSKTKDKKVVLNEPTALFNDELVKTKPNVTKNPKPTQKDKNSDVIVAKHSIFSRFKKEKTPIVVRRYQPDLQKGLTADDVEDRIALKLNNKTVTKKSKSYFRIFFDNIFSVFNIAIFAIFGWLISVSLWQQSMFVFVLIINIAIGIVQEIKAKKMIDNFSLITQPTVTVIRDSDTLSVKPEDIVLDDILVLEGGKQIVSDSIIKFGSVEVNESSLTGESDIIIKKPGDQLYSGSFVVSGNCKAIVSSVGKDNYIQKLTSQAKNIKKS